MIARLPNGGHIDGGIEFDAMGMPVAFHLLRSHPAEWHHGAPMERQRVPAADVVHVFRPTEALQSVRGPAVRT